ncbi:MAG TPA: AAA family ATPase [Streptosporangiaceae bacterium]|nr:AAA family ATPase [Streptosporangiaceae bacterium]
MSMATRGPLVGRQAEFGRLRALLRDAAAGRPVVALVSGDAGVGKTRLVAELSAQARHDGFAVLTGRCAELADTVPYLPLADALRDAAAGPLANGPLADALAARPVLSRLLPDAPGGQPQGADTPGFAQQQLFGAVLGMLSDLAEASPVLLVLEDLHWADRSTRDLVTFLSRVLHRERLAIVVTYRTDDLHRRHPLRPVIAELTRLPSVTTVALGPLSPSAMAEHLTSLSGGMLDAALLDSVITRAEGNAYYAEELLAAASTCVGELPARLADLLLARTERLSPAAQQVLRAAAVTGRRVDDELAREASGLAGPEYDDAVREAVAHQLLVPDGDRGYTFRHALLREAIYGDLLPGERTRLHARLAELLGDERRLAEVPGTAAELAQHSLASHDIPRAFAASVAAGKEADRLAAPAEAHRHYDQALSLWERVDDPEKLSGMVRGKLAFESANSAAASGDIVRAVQLLKRLIEYLGDGSADPKLRCRAGERLAYFLVDLDEDEAAIAAAEAAVAALPEEPPTWQRARALGTHARTLLAMKDEAPARAQAQSALAAARAAAAPWVEADALVTLGQLSERDGRIEEAIDLFTRAHQQALTATVLDVELRAAFQLARVQLEWGDLDAASSTAHHGVLRAEEAGLVLAPYGYDLQYLHYLAHYSAGEWDHAQSLADGFVIRVGSPAEARLSAMALFIEVARDRPSVALRHTWLRSFFVKDRFTEYIGRGLLAEHALWQGDQKRAAAEAEATVRAIEAYDSGFSPAVIRPAAVGLCALADLAWQARAAGDAARVEALVQTAGDLIEIAREGAAFPARPKSVLGVDGRGWLARAEAEWHRAQGGNDPAYWQVVVDVFGPAFVYETARSRWRLAEALAAAGRRDEAQQELLLAAEAADRIGATPLRAALSDLARRARLADRAAPEAAGTAGLPGGAAARDPLAGLTERELEVLRLLATGQTNREIGAELFIAPKTASVHVSNILAKLGAGSRTEAAAIAHAQGVGLSARRGG